MKDIVQSLKASSQQTITGFDAISEHGSGPKCAEVIHSLGGGKLLVTLPYPEDQKVPEDVEISSTFAAKVAMDKSFGSWLFNDWLQTALANKSYTPSPAIEKVDGGLGGLQNALDLHKKGLSGKKLVVSL